MAGLEAGKGEHRVYAIKDPSPGDSGRLTAMNHYIGVDAVAWYINKKSSWFTERMASGTLEIRLAGGLETYQVALGTFELDGGSRLAPVFDRSVLPDRNYRGGDITFAASLTAIKRDTVIAGLLKSAANASLGVTAGMVDTAGLTGPARLLSIAGSEIIGGVRTLLQDTGEKREPLFSFSGLEFALKPESVVGPRNYILLHRGTPLAERNLSISSSGHLQMPLYNNAPLEDGAWLLLRIRRSDEYSGVRDWFEATREFRLRVNALVDDTASGFLPKEEALREFQPSQLGDRTLLDTFVQLRGIIGNDGVLAEREAWFHIGQLRVRLDAARTAIASENRKVYYDAVRETMDAIEKGNQPTADMADALVEDMGPIARQRIHTVAQPLPSRRVASLDRLSILASLKYLPSLQREYLKDLEKDGIG
jgi:hypothetical protein